MDPHATEDDDPDTEYANLSREQRYTWDKKGFFEKGNRVYSVSGRGVKAATTPISNFTLRILYRMDSDEMPRRVVEATNYSKRAVVVELGTKAILSTDGLNECLANKGQFIWYGSKAQLINYVDWLMGQERACEPVDTLGWQGDRFFWAWGNGIYQPRRTEDLAQGGGTFLEPDVMGVITLGVKQNEHYYIPSAGAANRNNPAYQDERRFVYRASKITFAEWGDLFRRVYGENGYVGMAFWLSALFRDIVTEQARMFPLLFLFGMPQSGKSTMARSLMQLFGHALEPIAIGGNTTPKALLRKFGQFRNAIVWLDEYKNSVDPKWLETLKNLWDGIGYSMAQKTQDNKTKHQPIYSAAILSGQDMPTAEAALFTRCVLRRFDRRDERNPRTEDELTAFKALADHEMAGLSHLTCQALSHRQAMAGQWPEQFQAAARELEKIMAGVGISLDERLVRNAAVLLATVDVLAPRLPLPFTRKELLRTLESGMVTQSTTMAGTNELAHFWDMVSYLYADRELTYDEDFKVDGEHLYLRLTRVHGKYVEMSRRQGKVNTLDKATLVNYLKSSPAFVAQKDSYRIGGQVSSAFVFRRDLISFQLEDPDNTVPPPSPSMF